MRRVSAWILFLLLAAASPALALEVRATLWGFDGKVVPNRFNILSVLVENETARPFDGALAARRVDFNRPVGPGIVEPCYLVPFAARWVQFQIFIEQPEETWALSWGDGAKENATIPVARLGPPADVLLEPEERAVGGDSQVRRFPENLFPAGVTATDGLHAVVLDHVPKWETARRNAFMDWVRLGGVVHLARNSFGEYPQFGDDLADLGKEGRVGLGRVVLHPMRAGEINEQALGAAGFPPAALQTDPQKVKWGGLSAVDEVMRKLTEASKTRHNWLMIFGCAGMYLLLIGPVNWFLGRKMEYRRVLVYFAVIVVGCSVLMLFVGQRGRRGADRIFTITEARPLGGGQYALKQWTTLFATRGADYTVAHRAEMTGCVYAAPGGRTQPAQGIIRNGRGGGAVLDIPINSSRFMAHSARSPGREWAPEISGWGGQYADDVSVGGTLPPDILWAYAVANGKWTKLKSDSGKLRGAGGSDEFPADMGYGWNGYGAFGEKSDEDVDNLLRSAAMTVVAESSAANESFYNAVLDPAQPARHLFIACDGRGEFNLAPNRLGRERNIIVYHYSYREPGN